MAYTPTYTFVGGIANASYNTSMAQAALDFGGDIIFGGLGNCYITEPLLVGSDTNLTISNNLLITNLSTNSTNVIRTKCINDVMNNNWNTVTFSWSAGLTMTVGWTGHGQSVGNYVWTRGIAGTMPGEYFGIFRVSRVVDSDSFEVILKRRPSGSPSGAAQALQANTNISIIGGTFDYNFSNGAGSNPATNWDMHGVVLGGCQNLTVDTTSVNVKKFAFCLAGIRDFNVRLNIPYTSNDAVKVYGPAFDGIFSGISGFSGDDGFSIQPQEDPFFTGYDFAGGGDCLDIISKNIDLNSEGGAFHLYGHDDFLIDNVTADTISYVTTNDNPPVFIDTNLSTTAGHYGRIKVSNIDTSDLDTNIVGQVFIQGPVDIDQLDIEGISLPRAAISGPGTAVRSITTGLGSPVVRTLNISEITGYVTIGGSIVEFDGGSFGKVTVSDCSVTPADSNTRFINLKGGSITNLSLINNYVDSFTYFVLLQNTWTGSPVIYADNNNSLSLNGIEAQTSCLVRLRRNNFPSLTGYLLEASTGAAVQVNVDVDGSNSTPAGKLIANTGAGTLTYLPGFIKTDSFTFATLPSAVTLGLGARSFITDSSVTAFNTDAAGGGSSPVPVFSTGSVWRVG